MSLITPANVIRRILIAEGHGTLPTASGNWPIEWNNEPDRPDNAVTIYDTEGIDKGRNSIDFERIEYSGFQVRVRSSDPGIGADKAKLLARFLDVGVFHHSLTFDGETYCATVISRSGIRTLGKELPATARWLFTFNGTVYVTNN